MSHTRRDVLVQGLFSAAGLGLRALATGLPAGFVAGVAAAAPPSEDAAQLLVLSTSSAGDPINANTPGTYDHPAIVHSRDPRMAPRALRLGQRQTVAAAAWAQLPQPVLDRTVFFHHRTGTTSHPEHPQVLQLLGASPDSAPALYSQHLASRLHTRQAAPILIGTTERVRCGPGELPRLRCDDVKQTLAGPQSPLAGLGRLRDEGVDAVQRRLRDGGSRAQRDYLDRHALSRAEATALGDRLLADLSAIDGEDAASQVLAAAAILRLGLTPVVVLGIPFGGDNHFDDELATESEQTVAGVAHIAQLMRKLAEYGLRDRASFALLNVFGRTLHRHGRVGRDHWPEHATAVLIGKPFAGGVIGGLSPRDGDFGATAIAPHSGAAAADGDPGAVPVAQTLAALGKTLGRGLGLPQALLDRTIAAGQVVTAALA